MAGEPGASAPLAATLHRDLGNRDHRPNGSGDDAGDDDGRRACPGPLGDIWIIAESEYPGVDGHSVLILGYSPGQEAFVGSWIDSYNPHQWVYTGSLDDTGTTLTLFSEGPIEPGGPEMQIRETIVFEDDDHRLMTSQYKNDSDEWVTIVTMRYARREAGTAR